MEVPVKLRACLLGFLSWLIPFLVSFLLLPIKKFNLPLFTTLMYLIVLITAGALMKLYFRDRQIVPREALIVGTLWLAISLTLDFPMFGFGPMKMTPLAYYSEIGIVYATFPVFALLAAQFAKR